MRSDQTFTEHNEKIFHKTIHLTQFTKQHFTKQYFTKQNDIFKITTQNTMTSQHFTKHSRKHNISKTTFHKIQQLFPQNKTIFHKTLRFRLQKGWDNTYR